MDLARSKKHAQRWIPSMTLAPVLLPSMNLAPVLPLG